MTDSVEIPQSMLPTDGRFGCGPSKVRSESIEALRQHAPHLMGTSHRKTAVLFEVGALRNNVAELFSLPDGYEVLLSNGGSTFFWDAATFGLIENKSQHAVFGEFSSKFATASDNAPHLAPASVIKSEPGTSASVHAEDGVDLYALTHNETSTGVAVTIERPNGIANTDIVAVDATSAAGGLRVDLNRIDAYYFAPQKCLGSDGGLWIGAFSPNAIERIEKIRATSRFSPASLDLGIALDNSRKDQTYNTPAIATVFLANQQIRWILDNGGLEFAARRCDESANIIYSWADAHEFAQPFVADAEIRSHVVATIDFSDAVDAEQLAKILRANGILDVEPYRKLGRNQLRVALFPAIEPDDIRALTACIDHVIAALRS